jgi:hypothetical protein
MVRELIILGIISVCLMVGCTHMIAAMQQHHLDALGVKVTRAVRIQQYRTIPRCNKELWLRIKDGCT